MIARPLWDRFWEKVDRDGPKPTHVTLSNCWVWTAYRHTDGYGIIRQAGKPRRAARVAWEFANGPIPGDLHVLHKCDNRACVRAEHLFLGTHQDNMEDLRLKGRGRGKEQRGERHAMVKLTESQVVAIRHRVEAGELQVALAREFLVHKATINDVVKWKTWTHLVREAG